MYNVQLCWLTHLYISAPPTSAAITGSDGSERTVQSITLRCTSTGGSPAPTLTFKKGGAILATGSSPLDYSMVTAASDDGAVYVCEAQNGAGSVSDSVTFSLSCEYSFGSSALVSVI